MTTQSGKLTERARVALTYIDRGPGVSAWDIGRHMWDTMPGGGSNLIGIGSAFIGRFRRAGLITEVAPYRYATTDSGRQALTVERDG